ncbi:MAG: amidase [Planctomycetes bacterium]|nr:amidase [Planctomycetota bacterium]
MNSEDLCFLSAFELAEAIREKSVSPVEVMQAVLDRIERLNPTLNAFCTLTADDAIQAAKLAEGAVMKREPLGPLHGVPVSIKDNLYVKGVRTTFGSKLMEHHVADADAPVVARLRRAGAIIVGRTNTPEFGWKGVTDNQVFGITRNPWNLDLTPGGSSGGASAAVASGLGPIGIGTDGGGSLRIPASFCGLVGHKPSFGRVPHYPGISLGSLRHVGAITRTVVDSALALNVISGPDDRDPTSLPPPDVDFVVEIERGIEGLRVAYSPDLGYAHVETEVASLCAQAARKFSETGAVVEQVDLDWADPYPCWNVLFYGSATARLGNQFAAKGHLLDPGLHNAVAAGLQQSGTDITSALVQQYEYWQHVRRVFDNYDLLITPALAVVPFAVGQDNADWPPGQQPRELHWTQFTYPFNLTGQPAVSVPCGWTEASLPVGLQIVGRRFDDATVLRAARAWEKIQPWAERRPIMT